MRINCSDHQTTKTNNNITPNHLLFQTLKKCSEEIPNFLSQSFKLETPNINQTPHKFHKFESKIRQLKLTKQQIQPVSNTAKKEAETYNILAC